MRNTHELRYSSLSSLRRLTPLRFMTFRFLSYEIVLIVTSYKVAIKVMTFTTITYCSRSTSRYRSHQIPFPEASTVVFSQICIKLVHYGIAIVLDIWQQCPQNILMARCWWNSMSGLLALLVSGLYCLTTHDIRHEKGHEFILEDRINDMTV